MCQMPEGCRQLSAETFSSLPIIRKVALKVVASGGPKGVTRNELTRKTQFIRRSMRDEYLEDLVDAGEIVIREFSDGRGHGGTVYSLASFNVTACD